MPDKKQERFSPPAVGGTSLLVVFAVLCLTVFALLSLTTVQADVRLADASARSVAAYYEADCQAQAVLAYLRTGEAAAGSIPEDLQLNSAASDYPGAAGDVVTSYAVPISDTQELQVEVYLVWGEGWGRDASGYTILRWQAASSVEWMGSDSFTVWDGE